MISLLSPEIKEQLSYSKRNRAALHYLKLLIIIMVVLAASFASSIYYIDAIVDKSEAGVADKESQINSYAPALAKAKAVEGQLTAIQAITAKQTHFYRIIQGLGAAMPNGVAMDGITLVANNSQPVIISATGPSYDSILSFKDNLAKSNIIGSVALTSIGTADTSYRSELSIRFKNLEDLR